MRKKHKLTIVSILVSTLFAVVAVGAASIRNSNTVAHYRKIGHVNGSDIYKVSYVINGNTVFDATVIDMGEWVVIAQRNGNKWDVSIGFDFTKNNAEKLLIDLNRQFAMKLFPDNNDPIYVTVMFSRPIPFKEFSNMIRESGMKVVYYEIRGYERNGQPVTIGGNPSGDALVPQDKINLFKERAYARGRPFVIAGIIKADGYLTKDGYTMLMRSGVVRMVNVMRVLAKQIVKDYLGIDVAAEDIIGPMPYVKPNP